MKYEITDIACADNPKLFRIRALANIPAIGVKAGTLGGCVEGEHNLSQEGDCWVFGNARVFENALVFGNSQVFGNSFVSENAQVYGNAQVFGNAIVFGNSLIYGNAQVSGEARVTSKVHKNMQITNGHWTKRHISSGSLHMSDRQHNLFLL